MAAYKTGLVHKNRGWKTPEVKDLDISLQLFKSQILPGYFWLPTAQFAFQFEVTGLLDEDFGGFLVVPVHVNVVNKLNNFSLKLEVKLMCLTCW